MADGGVETGDSPAANPPPGGTNAPAKFGNSFLWLAVLFWLLACFALAGYTALDNFPREAFLSFDGQPVGSCSVIAPSLVAGNSAAASAFCTASQVLEGVPGQLPDGVTVTNGSIDFSTLRLGDWLQAVLQPPPIFVAAIGAIALLFLVNFSKATSTVRAGLAASITVVIFGLVLFPRGLTSLGDVGLRSQLVDAWKLIIAFYFGTEGAVQALRVLKPGSGTPGGDLEGPATG